MVRDLLVVYGVRTTNLDNHQEFIDTYESVYTTRELAQEYINFTATCMCNKCQPYKHTTHTIIPIIVVSKLNVSIEIED